MLQNHSFLQCLLKTNLIIYSGDVTTFVEKDQVKSPFDIAMNHKANCFYVVTNVAHIITKITSSGIYPTLLFSFFFPSQLLMEHDCQLTHTHTHKHIQELSMLLLEVDNQEALTELAQVQASMIHVE